MEMLIIGFLLFPVVCLIVFFFIMCSLSKGLHGTYKWWGRP